MISTERIFISLNKYAVCLVIYYLDFFFFSFFINNWFMLYVSKYFVKNYNVE